MGELALGDQGQSAHLLAVGAREQREFFGLPLAGLGAKEKNHRSGVLIFQLRYRKIGP